MSFDSHSLFFYAGAEADLYDLTVRLTERAYDSVHEAVCELLCHSLQKRGTFGQDDLVLDLGCGTGEEALRLLRALPSCRVVGVDCSAEMLRLCTAKARSEFGEKTAAARFVTVQVDFRRSGWLEAALRRVCGDPIPSAVVSAYALHHMQPDEKGTLYQDLARVLPVGGTFINGDLFSYSSPSMCALAQRQEEQWIQRSFQDEGKWHALGLGCDSLRPDDLLELWIAHVRGDNVPLPIYSSGNGAYGSLCGWNESDALIEAGFNSVECLYRFYQSGVVVSIK